MTAFDNRESGFEGKFVMDQKLDFAVEARLCKLFGLWIAQQMHMDETEAAEYASKLVTENLKEPGLEDVLRAVRKDLDIRGLEISEHVLHVQLEKAHDEALKQLTKE